MLKKDKNGFLNIIRENGFDQSFFESFEIEMNQLPSFVIRLKDSPLEFWTRNTKESFTDYDCNFVTFSPSFTLNGMIPRDSWFTNINEVYEIFSYWLKKDVQEYIIEQKVPDLWSILLEEGFNTQWQNMLVGDTDQFTNDEQIYLNKSINEFKTKLIDVFTPNKLQLADIDFKINYLTKSIERLNKFDWKSLLLSTLIGICTTLSLDKSTGETLFNIAKQIFSKTYLLH